MKQTLIFSLLLSVLISCNSKTSEKNDILQTENIRFEVEEESKKEVYRNKTQDKFWQSLERLCGKSFEGKFDAENVPVDFEGKALKMYVMRCGENQIKIPFYVGDDRSRTWVFTRTEIGIELKHDHRLEDGSHDEITMYGGTTANTGLENIQFFPADQETSELIPDASGNMWWVSVDEEEYTYNLKRVNTPNHFRVVFDLTKEIDTPKKPWGHE